MSTSSKAGEEIQFITSSTLSNQPSHHAIMSTPTNNQNSTVVAARPPSIIGSALTGNMITFTRVGEIIDVEDDEDEMEYEEDQISEITSPSSTEVASFHTLSETSSMVEDGADDIISIGDSSSGISSGSKRKLDDMLSSENGGEETKVVKRRIYHRRANPFPRVLKRDIRRDYGTMLLNVMNSFDGELTSKFFRTFCVQDCYKFDLFPEVKNYNLPCVRQVNGLDQIVFSLLHDLSHTPDCVLTMRSSHIRQRSDIKGSQVVLRVLFQGTKIYQNKNCNLEELQKQIQAATSSSSSAATTTSSSSSSVLPTNDGNSNNNNNNSSSSSSSMMDVSNNGGDDESDVNSVYSFQSRRSTSSRKSGVNDMGSMWLPLPPTVDENALKSLDLHAIEKYFENISRDGYGGVNASGSNSVNGSVKEEQLSAMNAGNTEISASEGIQQTLSNILQQFHKNGTQEDLINELMRAGNIDITKDEWYENAGISMLSKPFPITVDGTIIMHLDEDHRIRRFQFVSSSLVATNYTSSPMDSVIS